MTRFLIEEPLPPLALANLVERMGKQKRVQPTGLGRWTLG